jgi:SAM-dependent methyltransferase
MKRPADVGKDFDQYAATWSTTRRQMEGGYDLAGVQFDESKSSLVQRPGDEWGDVESLFEAYHAVIDRYLGDGGVDVLEIGAGGGRSTAVMLDLLGDRVRSYHVVDVSAGFIEVLKERIEFPLDVHVVQDVDLSFLPADRFSLCFSQSAWSHINLYDQYRYLREVRRVLEPGAPLYVHGQFLLGLGHEWTWNRFVRRVRQLEAGHEGVVHEFTSYAALAEMLQRLQYTTDCIFSNGFVARKNSRRRARPLAGLNGPLSFPYHASLVGFLNDGPSEIHHLPGPRRSPPDSP